MPDEYGRPEPRQKEPGQKGLSPKGRKLLFGAAVILSAVLMVYGVVRLVGYGMDWYSSRQTSQELREISDSISAENTASPRATAGPSSSASKVTAGSEAAALPETSALPEATAAAEENVPQVSSNTLPVVSYPSGLALSTKVQALRKKSQYIIGWLTMDDLEEAVVLKDNSFFLNHDAMGKRNDNGALFLDEDTEMLSRPYTLLIYGHNMKTGAMFGNLKKYEEPSYLYQHRYMKLETLFEPGNYEIFAASVVSLTPGLSRYLSLSEIQSPVRSVRRRALDTLVHLSSVPVITSVSEEDQVVLLITCVGNDDERLIVAAKRLPDEEKKTKAAK